LDPFVFVFLLRILAISSQFLPENPFTSFLLGHKNNRALGYQSDPSRRTLCLFLFRSSAAVLLVICRDASRFPVFLLFGFFLDSTRAIASVMVQSDLQLIEIAFWGWPVFSLV